MHARCLGLGRALQLKLVQCMLLLVLVLLLAMVPTGRHEPLLWILLSVLHGVARRELVLRVLLLLLILNHGAGDLRGKLFETVFHSAAQHSG